MTDLDSTAAGDGPLDPDEVSGRSFATAFRGFDPVQVRAFLGDVADELRRLRDEEMALRAQLAERGSAADDASARDASTREASAQDAAAKIAEAEAEAAAVVGRAREEAERLLREARERVEQLGSAATAETTRVLAEARAEAARLRATATDDLKGRFEEAEATAVRKIAEAEREAASIRVTAREEADATIEAARDRGREMVAEAQAARERMLADLAKRKRAAQAQLEQLRAGRDRLLDTLKVARRSIDEMTTRFDAGDGASSATTPPSSGMPTGPVTTTPGAPATEARARAAATPPTGGVGEGAERPRPVRARAVAIGEAPQPAARPQIAAPQAQAAVGSPPAPAPAPAASPAATPPAEVADASSAAVPLAPPVVEPAPAPPAVRSEERRSSALRILRRNKPAEPSASPPPLIGRDSPSEGVRIIGRPAAAAPAPTPEPEPEVAAVAAVEAPAVAPAEPDDADTTTDTDHVASVGEAGVPVDDDGDGDGDAGDVADETSIVAPSSGPEAAAGEPEPIPASPSPAPDPAPEPMADPLPEPEVAALAAVEAPTHAPGAVDELDPTTIRPKIEDLFARIRADREAATASAREVLASAAEATTTANAPVTPDAPDGPASSTDAESTSPAPGAEPGVATDADEHRLQARDRITEPLAGQLTKRLKRALQDEQNATLDRLRTTRGPASADQVLSRRDDQALPYRHLALPFLDEAARGGAAASPFGPTAVAADDLAAQLAEDLAGAIRGRLDAVLQAAASDGLDLASLSERISAVYREWKVQKVERLAVHYLIAAHERGGFLAHPEGTPMRWLVDDDGPCPDCDDNALAGPTPRGEAFPTGQLHPPAHLGCRCLLTPADA